MRSYDIYWYNKKPGTYHILCCITTTDNKILTARVSVENNEIKSIIYSDNIQWSNSINSSDKMSNKYNSQQLQILGEYFINRLNDNLQTSLKNEVELDYKTILSDMITHIYGQNIFIILDYVLEIKKEIDVTLTVD